MPDSFGGGRYAVQRLIGEGGKKRVYLARDTRLNREVAIAVLKGESLDEAGRERARREASAMGQLGDHANIVTVFDVAEEGAQLYLVSQLVTGGDLEASLAAADGHRLPIGEAFGVAEQICAALEYAAARGVIHRDVKPGNIFIRDDGVAMLGDFGLAVLPDQARVTQDGAMIGTVTYMPPEQALGREPDHRSDLYSLGAVIYEMVTGRPPFLGDDAVSIVSQHIHTAPVAPSWHRPDVPADLEQLILALLAKAPGDRPESAAAVAEELRRLREAGSATEPAPERAQLRGDLGGVAWGRFVGRNTEMDQLKSALGEALSARGSMRMLVGEPGIGKTRLSEEFAVYAEMRGARVLIGRCYEGELAVPYRPFAEAFREYVRTRPDEELRGELGSGAPELAKLVPEIRDRFPELGEAPALEADAERLRLFESVSSFVQAAASSAPILLILDDLHWSDKPSLLLLQYLARNVTSSRILILGAYRDVELDRTHPLAGVLAALRRERSYERILLRGLPQDDLLALLSAMDPSQEETAGRRALASALWDETEGNPFFVREVLNHLVEEGKLFREGGRWQANVTSVSDLGIPEGVREVVGRRLSRLGEDCNRMLTLASTMTDGFAWESLTAVTGESEARLLDLLDEALSAQVIVERKGDRAGRYDFTHALIRQTLYEELSTPRRVLLHRQIGTALEELYAESPEPHLSELAHHFYQAAPGGDVEKAIDYARRAGARAMDQLAYEEAAGHYEIALQALELRPDADPRERYALVDDLQTAYLRADIPEKPVAKAQQMFELAEALGDPQLLGDSAIRLANALTRAVFGSSEARRPLETALEALGNEPTALRANLLSWICMTSVFAAIVRGEPRDPALPALAREAREIAERIGDMDALSLALEALHNALISPEFTEERLGLATENVRAAESSGESYRLLFALQRRMVDLLELGRMDDADRELERIYALADALREPAFSAWRPAWSFMRAAMEGRYEEAERHLMETFAFAQRTQNGVFIAGASAQFYHMRRAQGRLEEVEPLLLERRQETPESPIWEAPLAVIYLETGRIEEARASFEKFSAQDFKDLPRDAVFMTMVMLGADLAHGLGDAHRAALLYEILRPYAARNIVVGNAVLCEGSASLSLGKLAAAMGDVETAARHLEDAIDFNERVRARPWLARSRYQYALVLETRGRHEDRRTALHQLNRAIAEFEEMGMKRELEGALALKLRLQGVDSSDTARSIDVLASSIRRQRPDLAPHAAPDGTVTLMFSDMEGFTPMTERLGDIAAREVIRAHNSIVREQLAAHGGYEVELQGDGFLLAFGSARQGVLCAIAIQRAFAAYDGAHGEPIRVRIGLHTGEALRDADRFFGRSVILAARIGAQAQAEQILVSSLLKQLTETAGDIRFGDGLDIDLKGISERQRVYEVEWR